MRNIFGKNSRVATAVFGFLAGAEGIGLAAIALSVILITMIPANIDVETERASIYALTLAHIPLMAIEGVFTALVALFLKLLLGIDVNKLGEAAGGSESQRTGAL